MNDTVTSTEDGRCEHDRTAAMCEACVHAEALADPARAHLTRTRLYRTDLGIDKAVPTGSEPEPEQPGKVRRR